MNDFQISNAKKDFIKIQRGLQKHGHLVSKDLNKFKSEFTLILPSLLTQEVINATQTLLEESNSFFNITARFTILDKLKTYYIDIHQTSFKNESIFFDYSNSNHLKYITDDLNSLISGESIDKLPSPDHLLLLSKQLDDQAIIALNLSNKISSTNHELNKVNTKLTNLKAHLLARNLTENEIESLLYSVAT